MQPVIATARTYGCKGYFRSDMGTLDHFVVYWLGSSCGALLVTFVFPSIRKLIIKCLYHRKNAKIEPAVTNKDSNSAHGLTEVVLDNKTSEFEVITEAAKIHITKTEHIM